MAHRSVAVAVPAAPRRRNPQKSLQCAESATLHKGRPSITETPPLTSSPHSLTSSPLSLSLSHSLSLQLHPQCSARNQSRQARIRVRSVRRDPWQSLPRHALAAACRHCHCHRAPSEPPRTCPCSYLSPASPSPPSLFYRPSPVPAI
ncbi:hypothetical protein KC19_3G234200, partial [Ceratodon purpureus]